MYKLPKELKQNIEALIREATFRDVKAGDVINIVAQLQQLVEDEPKES